MKPIFNPRRFSMAAVEPEDSFMTDGMAKLLSDICRRMSDQRDAIITAAVTERLGDHWTPIDLVRSRRLIRAINWNRVETYILDGIPILELHPMGAPTKTPEGYALNLTLSQSYKLL
jgi:hypothetical protein